MRASSPKQPQSPTSSLIEFSSDSSHSTPPVDSVRIHRRRASESSYYPVRRPNRQHSDQSMSSSTSSTPPQRRPLTLSEFKLDKVLGNGGTATVIRAEPVVGTAAALAIPARDIALKAVQKKGLGRRAQHFLVREIAIHRSVQGHPNIAALYDVFEDAAGIYLAMELLRGSDLYSVLKRERSGFPEAIALEICSQILSALEYMHSMGCAHRDIKPENVMFSEKPNIAEGKVGVVKLIDFGLACIRDPKSRGKDRSSSEKCGTVRYAAPEIITETSYIPEQCDMWSVGIVLYSMIAHRNPYTGKTERDVLFQIQNSSLSFDNSEWDSVSAETKNLIRWCLSQKGSNRPSAAQALQEVKRIQVSLSNNVSPSSVDEDEYSESERLDGSGGTAGGSQDVASFPSRVTPESRGHAQRAGKARRNGSESPRSHSVEDEAAEPALNFFDGMLRAWFHVSPDRSSSQSPTSGSGKKP